MIRRKNHTDRAFREPLRKYQAAPPEGVWSGITEALGQDRRKSRIAWMRRIAASAAVIIAAGSIWMIVQRTPETQLGEAGVRETVADQQDPQTETGETTPPETEPMETQQVPYDSRPGSPDAEQVSIPGELHHGSPGKEQVSYYALQEEQQDRAAMAGTVVTEVPARITGKNIYRLPAEYPGTEALLAVRSRHPAPVYPEEGIDVFDEFGDEGYSVYDKWAIGGQVSPVYSYRNLDATEASAAAGYYNEIENGIVSYSGGVNINYFPAKRLSLQSGLYYSRIGMTVGNTYLASSDNKMDHLGGFPKVQMAMSNSSGQIEMGGQKANMVLSNTRSSEGFVTASPSYTITGNAPAATEGEILQHFEYIEVPMILRYRLVDRRLGFNLLGGLSTNFLVGSNAYFQDGDNREYIGTTEGIKPVNYSSVLGVGLQYFINGNFHINMEPTFRYYLNSINTGSGIGSHPYSLGFFTGISYSF